MPTETTSLSFDALDAFMGESGSFVEDHAAIRNGAVYDGSFMYEGCPATPGFKMIKQPGTAILFALSSCNGVAYGDAMSVQYAASGGRAGLLNSDVAIDRILDDLRDVIVGRKFHSFRDACSSFEEGSSHLPFFTAIAYGISQALLGAFASHRSLSMAEVIRQEYGLHPCGSLPLILCQTDSHDISQIDRMVFKGADILPHGNFNCVERIGRDGEAFRQYVSRAVERIRSTEKNVLHRVKSLHFDLYGTLGDIFGYDVDRIAAFLAGIEKQVAPFPPVGAEGSGWRRSD